MSSSRSLSRSCRFFFFFINSLLFVFHVTIWRVIKLPGKIVPVCMDNINIPTKNIAAFYLIIDTVFTIEEVYSVRGFILYQRGIVFNNIGIIINRSSIIFLNFRTKSLIFKQFYNKQTTFSRFSIPSKSPFSLHHVRTYFQFPFTNASISITPLET